MIDNDKPAKRPPGGRRVQDIFHILRTNRKIINRLRGSFSEPSSSVRQTMTRLELTVTVVQKQFRADGWQDLRP